MMFTRFPDRGTRVAELLHSVTVERFIPSNFQPDYEVIRFQLTPLVQANKVDVARAIHAHQNLTLFPNGNLLTLEEAPPLSRSLERRIAHLAEKTYDIEVRWSQDRTHPRIFCLSPIINRFSRPKNAHLFTTWHPDVHDAQGLCVYPPHENVWDPQLDDPFPLLVWIATYLACDAIQVATGQWIGKQASHNIKQIAQTHGQNQCWCGSGQLMTLCHSHTKEIVSPARRRFL